MHTICTRELSLALTCLAHHHEQLAAAREKARQACEVLVDAALIDARLVEPDCRLAAVLADEVLAPLS